jgi:MFS family permease
MNRVRSAVASTVGGLPREYWWLWAGRLVTQIGAFVLPFLAFYLTDELELSATFVGMVLGAFGAGSIVASLWGGVLSDRLGRRPVLLGSQLATAANLVALGLTQEPGLVLAFVALLGLTSNMSRPAYAAMMTDLVEPKDRVRAFSLNYWAINLGFAIAPVLGGVLAEAGYLTLFLADAATTLVFALLVYVKVPETRPEPTGHALEKPGTIRDVLRDRVFASFVLLQFGFAVVFMQHLSTLPVQMGDDGLEAAQFGLIIAINGALIALVTVPLARWLERFARSRVLAVGMAFVGVGFGLTAWATTPAQYALTVVLWSIGEVIGAAVAPAIVADLSPAHLRGRYQGVGSFAFSGAALVAPILGGWTYEELGGPSLWLACAVVSFAAAIGHLVIAPARAQRLAELRAADVMLSSTEVP